MGLIYNKIMSRKHGLEKEAELAALSVVLFWWDIFDISSFDLVLVFIFFNIELPFSFLSSYIYFFLCTQLLT